MCDIKSTVLIIIAPLVSPIISQLFSWCIDAGIFPDNLKIAKNTSVHKKSAKSDISNYRLISILNNIREIFEGLIHKRILNFFHDRNLLCETQYGFCKNKNS